MNEFLDCLNCDDVMDFVNIIKENGVNYLVFKCLSCDSFVVIKQF